MTEESLMIIIVTLVIILIALTPEYVKYFIRKNKKNDYVSRLEREVQQLRQQQYENQAIIDELQKNRNIYHRAELLTKNERLFYERLRQRINPNELQILAKIRLADLIEVNQNQTKAEWGKAFNRIKSKHVDFAIAKNMNVMIIIELDDNSHYKSDRKERDNFVDEILLNAGYKVVRTYGEMLPVEQALMDIGYNLETMKLM